MKLAIITGKKYFFDGVSYFTTGGAGVYVDEHAKLFDEIYLCVPVKHVKKCEGYKISSKNVKIFEVAWYKQTVFHTLTHLLTSAPTVFRVVKSCDMYHTLVGSYESYLGFIMAKLLRKPVYTYMGGDPEWSAHYWRYGNIKILTYVFEKTCKIMTVCLLRTTPSFLMGEVIYEKYKRYGSNAYVTANSTLKENDIYRYRDTCMGDTIRLLFVGRLYPEKKIGSILKALKILNEEYGIKTNLTIVGDGMERNKLSSKYAIFTGYVPLGQDLNGIYRNSDIFVFPSEENTIAKVVIEAMANGLPIIVSNTGAAPPECEHEYNCIFIEPGSSKQIVDAVRRLIKADSLRQNMIKNNLELSRKFTLDNILAERYNILKKLYPKIL